MSSLKEQWDEHVQKANESLLKSLVNECDDNGENCDRCRGMKREDICDALGDARCVVEALRAFLNGEPIAGDPIQMLRRQLECYDETRKPAQCDHNNSNCNPYISNECTAKPTNE